MTGKSRIQQAMAHIEQAEFFLEQAVMELAEVRGMSAESDRLSTLRDHVKSSWNLLKNNLLRTQSEAPAEL